MTSGRSQAWPDIGPLDDLSIRFGAALFERFPEWREFARADRDDDNPDGFLVVEVPTPEGSDLAYSLSIYTENDEVTIAMDRWHSHFNWPAQYEAEDPLSFLQALVREEIVVVSWWKQDEWVGSSTPSLADSFEKPESFGVATRMRVRSWRGTLNRDVQL